MGIKLATFEENFWQLRSAEESNSEYYDSFEIPELEHRQNLKRGYAVKLIFDFVSHNENGEIEVGGERMWVVVKEKIDEFYLGILDNQPISIEEGVLDKNAEIYFKAQHIIALGYPPKEYLEERFGKDFLNNE